VSKAEKKKINEKKSKNAVSKVSKSEDQSQQEKIERGRVEGIRKVDTSHCLVFFPV